VYLDFFVTRFMLSPFNELSLMGLRLDMVDQPSSYSADQKRMKSIRDIVLVSVRINLITVSD